MGTNKEFKALDGINSDGNASIGGNFTVGSNVATVTVTGNSSGDLRLFNNIPLRFGTANTPGNITQFANNQLQISGSNVNIGQTTLFIDTTNSRIGVGKNNPRDTFDIAGRLIANTFVAGLATVASGSTITFDLTKNLNYEVTLTQNATFAFTIDAETRGQAGMIIIHQDSTGGRTFTLPTQARTPVGGLAIAQQTQADSTSILNYFIISPSIILVNYIGNFQ
jgi:hypothetical protein